MSSMTSRDNVRRPRSRWFDPRLATGITLVVASVVGVVVIVSSVDRTVTAYAAGGVLTAGERIVAGDLVEREVRLGSLTEHYLVPGDIPDSGLVVTRTVTEGELIPASAVGTTAGARVSSLVVSVHSQLPRSVSEGSLVDLWAAPAVDASTFGPPTVVVAAATVVRVLEQDGLIAGGSVGVELSVPRARTARVLEALANGDVLSVVPVATPAKG